MARCIQMLVSAVPMVAAALFACEGHVGPLGPVALPEGDPQPEVEPRGEEVAKVALEVLTFEASPQAGVAPHVVTFSWSAQFPAGGTPSCALDFETDGTFDLTFDDCRDGGSAQGVFDAPGLRDVTLTFTGAEGETASATLQVLTEAAPTVDVRFARVEFGQSVLSEDLRLVAGKPALLRAHLLANESGTEAPPVRVRGVVDGTVLGALPLTGPGTVPTVLNPSSLAHSYTVELPPEWVRPGLRLELEVDPENVLQEADEGNNGKVLTPAVGDGTVLYLRAVPVVHGGQVASVPQSFATSLWRLWPLKEVDTQTRAPYTFGGTLTGSNTSAWASLLQELASVRASDGSARYYYGFVGVSYSSGVAGIGYLGSPTATGRNDSPSTMVHELGHNFGRSHAPCGTSGDGNYPYANARLGTFGYALDAQELIPPQSAYDVMSYCRPAWISDYNYGRVQDFLEAKPPKALVQQGEEPLLLVAGSLDEARVVRLRPVFKLTGARAEVEPGPFTLRVHGPEGSYDRAFGVLQMDEVAERHFSLLVPDPGEVLALEILHGEQVLYRQVREPRLPAQGAPTVREVAGALEVRWDAAAQPWLRVQHVGDERTTLGLWLRGGFARLPLDGLPRGGEWELSTSDGLSGARGRLGRVP